ncbi:DNA-binding transcriptional repressor DeoR [Photobacterium sp. MCCC 1A19761]|uniref:DNA-binding transcriptional repressor DeoR n=1 Tax=Photobacterium sp. MCCC 1A19761 TaxID=3115000 RepID=UPI00307D1309
MAETKRDRRLKQLHALLAGREKIHLKEAAQQLGVSEMTIRRDFSDPCELVSLIGGYIVSKPRNQPGGRYILQEETGNHVQEKQLIGSMAAAYVAENQTIFFDNGTTNIHLIAAIDEQISFTGVCFSLNTFMALKKKANCTAILCGGEYDPQHDNFYPLGDQSEIDNLRFDLMFVSAAGVDVAMGITCYSYKELPYKRKAIRQSRQKILLADHSKLGTVKSAFVCDLKQMDQFICDADIPLAYQECVLGSGAQ